jgi:CHAT domain-containing protein/ankyrin repeat protein
MNRLFLLFLLFSAQLVRGQALIEAIKVNNLELAKKLIKQGENLNQTDSNGATPLMWAVLKSDLNFCKFLVKKGANPYKKGVIYVDESKTQYYGNLLGICAMNDKYNILEWLVKSIKIPIDDKEYNLEDGVENGWTALQYAVYKGNISDVNRLLKLGANANYLSNNDSNNILMEAISYGHKTFVKEILELKGIDFYRKNTLGFDALHFAVFAHNSELVEYLIQKGFNVNEQSDSLVSPLHTTVSRNYLDLSKLLIQKSADTTLKNIWGETPGYIARYYGYKGQQKILKNNFEACANRSYDTLFHYYEKYYNLDNNDSIAKYSGLLHNQAVVEFEENTSQYVQSLNYAGIGYYQVGAFQNSLFYFKKSLAQLKKYRVADTADRCQFLRNIISNYAALGFYYDSTASHFNEVIPLTKKYYGDTSVKFIEISKLKIVHQSLDQNDENILLAYQKLMRYCDSIGKKNTAIYFEIVNSILVIYANGGNTEQTLIMFDKIWQAHIKNALPTEFDFKNSVKNICIFLSNQGENDRLLTYLNLYKKLIRESKTVVYQDVFSYNFIKGGYLFENGKYDSAIIAYKYSILFGKLKLKQNENTVAYCYLKTAEAYNNLKQFEPADHYLDTAIKAFNSITDLDAGFINQINTVEIAYYNFGEYKKALKLNDIRCKMAYLTQNAATVLLTEKNRFYILFKDGQIEASKKQMLKLLDLEKQINKNDPKAQITFLKESCFFYSEIGDTFNAIKNFKQVIELANLLKNKDSVQLDANFKIALIREKVGNISKALNWFVPEVEKIKLQGKYGLLEKRILDNYFEVLLRNNKKPEAIALCNYWIERFQNVNLAEESSWRIDLGDIYNQTKDYKSAESNYKIVEKLRLKHFNENSPEMVLIHAKLGSNYYSAKQYDLAIPYFKKVIETEEKNNASEEDLKSYYHSLKKMYFAINDVSSAENYSDKLIKLNKDDIKSDFNYYLQARIDHIQLKSQIGKYDEAELVGDDLLKKMYQYSQFTNKDRMRVYKMLGYLYSNMGNVNKALMCIDSTSEIIEKYYKTDLKLATDAMIQKALLYTTNGKSGEGLNELRDYKEHLKERVSDTSEYLNQVLTYLGLSYLYRFQFDSAQSVLREVQKHYLTKNIKNEIVIQALQYSSSIYTRTKRYDSALVYMRMAQAVAAVNSNLESYYRLSIQIGTIFAYLKQYDSSLAIYNSILDNPNRLGLLGSEMLKDAALEKAYVLNATQKYDEAFAILTNYLKQTKEQILDEILFLSAAERESFITTKSSSLRTINKQLIAYANKSPQLGSLILNNEIFIKGLALETNTKMLQLAANSNDAELNKLLDQIKTGRNKLENLYADVNVDQNVIRDLENKINTWEKSLNKTLGVSFKEDYLKNYSEEIKAKLGPNDVLVDFFSREKISEVDKDTIPYYAIVLAKSYLHPKVIRITDNKALDQLFTRTEGLSDASQLAMIYDSRGSKLVNKNTLDFKSCYELIWQKLDEHMSGKKDIYITPSGYLSKVAFAAIKDTNMVYISDKYNIHILSSSRQILKTENTKAPKQKTGVVIGGINYERDSIKVNENLLASSRSYVFDNDSLRTGFTYLPGTYTETQKIVSYLSSNKFSLTYLTGNQATEKQFKEIQKSKPYFIHIATHGFYLPQKQKGSIETIGAASKNDNPLLRSGLMLAGGNEAWLGKPIPAGVEDGILNSFEISNLDLRNTKFVVLSACETGLGDIKGSEGVFGLQRAFKLAGVEYIINSLWQVPDEQTSELMQNLYYHWSKGMSFEESFFKAQKTLKAKYDPYYWAAFQLVK